MPKLKPTSYELRFGVYPKPWSSWWTSGLFDQMFGLSHGQKCHFSQMS